MTLVDAGHAVEAVEAERELPPEVAMVMSALEAGQNCRIERRMMHRFPFRAVARLRLFRDAPDSPGFELFTRDINRRGVGFITRHRLPLGYGGTVALPGTGHKSGVIHCTLFRCREAAPGWFEGCLGFNREQPQYDR
jgi:hypothetical protein